ncbi:MAG: AMP-binding protein [Bacillaceae bacterium]|nr:AMP-binding protein [Bacillaceae bacterium]
MVNYDESYRNFKWEVPEKFNFCRDVFDRHDPEKLAMLWVDDDGNEERITFGEFANRSKRLANVFKEHGLKKGETVILLLSRYTAWWESILASLRSGLVVSPGSIQLRTRDLAYRLKESEAVAVITDDENAAKVDEALAQSGHSLKAKLLVNGSREGWMDYQGVMADASDDFEAADTLPDDPAFLFFTSGTTGSPKMAKHTQASCGIGHQVTGRYWLDLTPDDLHWNLSDTGWAKAAWSSFFGPWIQGSALFIHHTPRFDPVQTLQLLEKYPITTFCGAPTIFRMLVQEDLTQYKLNSLRHCVAAGEPLNPEVIAKWKNETGLTIYDGFGQTETVLLIGNFPPNKVKPGSMGKPAPGFYVSVIDENGNECGPNEEGDVAVRTKPERPVGLFAGYWKNEEKTKNSFRGDWYLTGDRAYKDEDGYFWFVGRSDDVIISAGYRIGPFEIESVLLEHPAVTESAVVASPDPTRGEIVKAFVVLGRGHEPSDELVKDLQEFVKEKTAPYKYPREIEFVTELPKTVSGKIRRVELRQMERERKNVAN